MGLMFKYFGCSWMFVESYGWVLSASDIASRFGGVRGCARILQIPEIFRRHSMVNVLFCYRLIIKIHYRHIQKKKFRNKYGKIILIHNRTECVEIYQMYTLVLQIK